MKSFTVPSALVAALCCAVQGAHANPLPPNAAHILPAALTLAPLVTPPAPAAPAGAAAQQLETDAHILRDAYLVVLDDSLADHEVDEHHASVDALHAADQQVRALKADGAPTAPLRGTKHRFHVGGNKHGHRRAARKAAAKKQLRGYAGSFSESTVDAIRAMKGVKYVERDSLVWASDLERNAPWGLARISHRKMLGLSTFNRYEYDSQGGEGVDAYVIDTGVNINHVELEGRAKWGKTIPQDPDQDLNGHGSHVAGTIASRKYGVAKKANIIAVKVLGAGGSGSMSDVVAGVAWAADSAAKQAKLKAEGKNSKHKGSVANMSLGGGKSQALDDAVDAAVDDGLHFAVAAGNDNRDACAYSPAAAVGAITVGASTIGDERAYFSNHGKCVDIFAPGLDIQSIWNSGNTSTNKISGTSMASPHIAGLAAYMLGSSWAESAALDEARELALAREPSFAQQLNQFAFGAKAVAGLGKPEDHLLSPKALKRAMLKIATPNVFAELPAGSPNLLSFNNYTAPAGPRRGKWRSSKEENPVEHSLVEAYLEDLKEEMDIIEHELHDELDEMTELVREIKEAAF
ncbi:S8 family peptidase [Rhodotorula paludigena]|uniref:S8 family peptidase n=1 Tax=Rhodotorula paludigena TaxID=86838 RepID=UPI00317B689B